VVVLGRGEREVEFLVEKKVRDETDEMIEDKCDYSGSTTDKPAYQREEPNPGLFLFLGGFSRFSQSGSSNIAKPRRDSL